VLRAVGAVFVVVFAGILGEAQVLVGPNGLIPISWFLDQQRQAFPSLVSAIIGAPSLFWVSSSAAMINILGGLGLLAATALVLNVAPRLALFTCWIALLSFVNAWGLSRDHKLTN